MKLATLDVDGRARVACNLDPAASVASGWRLAPEGLGDMVEVIAAGAPALAALRALAVPGSAAPVVPAADAVYRAPIQRFRRDVLCTGWNYWDHFYESAGKREGQDVPKPDAPTFFTKAPDVVIGPYDDIAWDPQVSAKWDYEAEIVLVIGRGGRSIPRERALEHVFGYCLANDVSQRDLQRRHGGQWLKGKSIDRTMPLGPWITLRDDVELGSVVIDCELNGELMQHASASEMAFDVAELVSELSFGMTLHAGDILLTGTPSGIGNARTPPVYLQGEDRLVTRGSGLGELRNRLRPVALAAYDPA